LTVSTVCEIRELFFSSFKRLDYVQYSVLIVKNVKMQKRDEIIHNLVSREIHSVMGAKDLNAKPFPGKFISQKGHQYYEAKYRNSHKKFIKSSADELKRIHREYPSETVSRDVAAQEDMWGAAVKLHSAIISNDAGLPKHTQNRFIDNLSEAFCNKESKRCISRPNFYTCMMDQFKQMATDNPSRSINMSLETLYDKFDVLGNDCFNWRRFLFYLRVVANPTIDCRDQLLHAFRFIASHDGIDSITSAKASIDIHDIATILFPLVRADYIHEAVSVMDDAWLGATSSATWDRSRWVPQKVTIEVFEDMLKQKSIDTLLAQSSSNWGRYKSFPVFISQWEHQFYNARLLQLVRDQRIRVSIRNKLQRDANELKRLIWHEWKAYTLYNRSLRFILNLIDVRTMRNMKNRGLQAFLEWSSRSLATLTIQRVCRGRFGRTIALSHWIARQSAITIQCFVRMCFAKKMLSDLSSEYYLAIITVQRIIRGAIGRRVAFKRLMSFVEQEHMRNTKEKERLLMLRGIWSLKKLQSSCRRIKAKSRANELRAMRQRENDIRNAMEARREKFRKERKIYKRQLEEYYRSKKDEHIRSTNIQSKVAKDQVSVRTLRRRLKNDELKKGPDNTEHILTQDWLKNWEIKIERGVDDMKHYCAQCIKRPDNRAEKKIGASVNKRIKARTKEVLKRADSRGIPMETKEATQIATDEIIYIIGEEERDRLNAEMNKAFDQREKEKAEARIQAEIKRSEERTRASVFAASLVARACRMWLARKQLRLKCLEVYEKDYDERSHAFYYRNKETGETSWAKPKAMGSFEMPTKDEWKVLRDAHNFPYYFNPFRLDMQWNPPVDKAMCCQQVPHDWHREFPVRIGRCPNFAIYEDDDGNGYCYQCYIGDR
jgi:hypothetical protein